MFNVSHFKAKSKTTLLLVKELLFADNDALHSHSSQGIQRLINAFTEASKKFGLKIKVKKTEVLCQPIPSEIEAEDIMLDGNKLNSVSEFTYFGSTISYDARIDAEIQKRMAMASAAFGRLHKRTITLSRCGLKAKYIGQLCFLLFDTVRNLGQCTGVK